MSGLLRRLGDWLAADRLSPRDRALFRLAERAGEEHRVLTARVERLEAVLRAHGIDPGPGRD